MGLHLRCLFLSPKLLSETDLMLTPVKKVMCYKYSPIFALLSGFSYHIIIKLIGIKEPSKSTELLAGKYEATWAS